MIDDPYVPLWNIERGFWCGDASFYQNNLTEDALIAFAPPIGLLPKARAVASLAALPRWEAVELEDCRALFVSDCVVLLAYRACGFGCEDHAPHAARVVSSYVKRRGRWMLVFQQHTPEGLGAAPMEALLATGLAGTARPAPSA